MADKPEDAAREVAAQIAMTVVQCVRNGKIDVGIEEIAQRLLAFRRAALEEAAKVAEEWADHQMRGIIIGPECASLPNDGDPVAPMISDSSAAAKLANELAKVKAHMIASALRALAGSTKEGE